MTAMIGHMQPILTCLMEKSVFKNESWYSYQERYSSDISTEEEFADMLLKPEKIVLNCFQLKFL
jgi:hypothetical protein